MHHETLTTFFQEFEQAGNSSDTDRILSQFADPFTLASPQGPQTISASDFVRVLPRRKTFFDQLGLQETTLNSLRTTSFNDHFALADTTWRMRFLLPDSRTEELIVASSYLVYIADNAPKIFTYIPHREITEILRDRGILPSTGTEQSSA